MSWGRDAGKDVKRRIEEMFERNKTIFRPTVIWSNISVWWWHTAGWFYEFVKGGVWNSSRIQCRHTGRLIVMNWDPGNRCVSGRGQVSGKGEKIWGHLVDSGGMTAFSGACEWNKNQVFLMKTEPLLGLSYLDLMVKAQWCSNFTVFSTHKHKSGFCVTLLSFGVSEFHAGQVFPSDSIKVESRIRKENKKGSCLFQWYFAM